MTAGPEIEKCPRCEKAVYEAESAFAGTYIIDYVGLSLTSDVI